MKKGNWRNFQSPVIIKQTNDKNGAAGVELPAYFFVIYTLYNSDFFVIPPNIPPKDQLHNVEGVC